MKKGIQHHRAATYVQWDEMENLINKLIEEKKNKLALRFICGSFLALRYSDLSRIKYSDLRGEKITIIEKKTGKERIITPNEKFYELVKKATPENLYKDGYIFSGQKGILTIQAFNKHLKRIRKKYGINIDEKRFSSHSLRKTGSRRIYERNGKNEFALLLLNELLGHTSIACTKRYIDIRSEEIQTAYKNM